MIKDRCRNAQKNDAHFLSIWAMMVIKFVYRKRIHSEYSWLFRARPILVDLPHLDLNGMTSSIGHMPMLLNPPSTAIHCPVMYEAAGDARNATSPAIFSHAQQSYLVKYKRVCVATAIRRIAMPESWPDNRFHVEHIRLAGFGKAG